MFFFCNFISFQFHSSHSFYNETDNKIANNNNNDKVYMNIIKQTNILLYHLHE